MEISSGDMTTQLAGDVTKVRRPEQTVSHQETNMRQGSCDKVSVSHEARLLSEARRAAEASPDVRTDKVEALRIQVANGTYKPDSRLIAENLLREEPGIFAI